MKDIWDIREAKLRRGVDQMISQQESFAKVSRQEVLCWYVCSIV